MIDSSDTEMTSQDDRKVNVADVTGLAPVHEKFLIMSSPDVPGFSIILQVSTIPFW